MEQIFGKGVSKGVAAGPISFYRRASGVIPRHEVSDTAAELERFRTARETAKEQLAKLYDKALAEAGEDAANAVRGAPDDAGRSGFRGEHRGYD